MNSFLGVEQTDLGVYPSVLVFVELDGSYDQIYKIESNEKKN